jgi:hypothetical protein
VHPAGQFAFALEGFCGGALGAHERLCDAFPFPSDSAAPKQHAAIKRSLTFHTVVRLSLLQVPRHPELIRLTGRHPFNIEPPLTTLMDQGLITSPDIHIVRNHGAVPKLDWETHK